MSGNHGNSPDVRQGATPWERSRGGRFRQYCCYCQNGFVELGNCFVGRPGKKQLGGLRGLASPELGLWSYFSSKAEERSALASHSRNPKVMAPQLTDRDATLSARRVCCPCSGHMSTSVFVIDRGSRTQPKPDARQCRCGSDTLSLYATVGLLRSCREDAHINAGLPEISESPRS